MMRPSKPQSAIPLWLPGNLSERHASSSLDAHDLVLRLFDDCAPGLRRYAGSFRLGSASTDDVVQEVFLSLFRHLRLGRPQTNLRAWLFQVAHNLALKQRQKSTQRQRTECEWDPTLTDRVADPTGSPEQRLVDDQRRQQLLRILQAMPERDRQCVYLRAEGLGYREIATALGISLGSVAKSLGRAFSRLASVDRG